MLLCTAGRILLGCPSAPSSWPSWWPPRLQNRSPWWSPWAKGKEKSHTEQDQVNREVVPVRRCSSWPGTAGCSGRCEQVHCRGEAATICPAATLLSSRALSEAKAAGSLCRLADWSSGPVARTTHCWSRSSMTSKNVINMTYDFWFWLSCFVRHQRHRRLPLTALAFGFRVVLKNPCLISSDDSMKQVWFSLKTLSDVLTHLHAALRLIIIQQPWHQFCAGFPHERRCKQKHVKQNSVVVES